MYLNLDVQLNRSLQPVKFIGLRFKGFGFKIYECKLKPAIKLQHVTFKPIGLRYKGSGFSVLQRSPETL